MGKEIELGLNEDLEKIRLWLQANKLSLNVAKTVYAHPFTSKTG